MMTPKKMTPKKINNLLDNMLGLAEGDVEKTYDAWCVAHSLYHFFSQIDANVYWDDPMSQSAPFECYDAHMGRWQDLNRRLESFEHIQAEEAMNILNEERKNPDMTEGVPF